MTTKLDIKNYCNNLYTELEDVKSRINVFINQIENYDGQDGEHIRSHADHLREINKTIDWKLDVFTKVCPLESGGYDKDAVEGASVYVGPGQKFPGGYLGG